MFFFVYENVEHRLWLIIFKISIQPIGSYDQCECVMKLGKKIEKKTPTIDKIAKLYGWLREELDFNKLKNFSSC